MSDRRCARKDTQSKIGKGIEIKVGEKGNREGNRVWNDCEGKRIAKKPTETKNDGQSSSRE